MITIVLKCLGDLSILVYISHTPATLYITIFQQVCSSIKNIANINQNKHVLSSTLQEELSCKAKCFGTLLVFRGNYRKSASNKIKLKVNSYRLNETAQYEKRNIIKCLFGFFFVCLARIIFLPNCTYHYNIHQIVPRLVPRLCNHQEQETPQLQNNNIASHVIIKLLITA